MSRKKQEKITPKEEVFCVEHAGGLDPDESLLISGHLTYMPAMADETKGQRRTQVVRQALRRIDTRIDWLEESETSIEMDHAAYLRNRRALAELRWFRAVVANGGTEPTEWAPEDTDADAMAALWRGVYVTGTEAPDGKPILRRS
jgi:hypothetical protein